MTKLIFQAQIIDYVHFDSSSSVTGQNSSPHVFSIKSLVEE